MIRGAGVHGRGYTFSRLGSSRHNSSVWRSDVSQLRRQCSSAQRPRLVPVVARTGSGRRNRKPERKNALDTTMAWGDVLCLFATELASERIPLTACMPHCSISVLAWVAVACLKGDYRLTQAADAWFGGQQRAMLQAICSGAATWALFVPVVLAVYAYMVTDHVMDPAILMAKENGNQLPAQMEVIFASLWSVGSWRGIYAGLRPYI